MTTQGHESICVLVVHHDEPAAVQLAQMLRAESPRFVVTMASRLDADEAFALSGSVDVALLPPDADLGLMRVFQGEDTPCALLWTEQPDPALERLAARLQLDGTSPVAPRSAVEAALARALAQRARTHPGDTSRDTEVSARWLWDGVTRHIRLDAHASLPVVRERLRALLARDVDAVLAREVASFHHEHEIVADGLSTTIRIQGTRRLGPRGEAMLRGMITVVPTHAVVRRGDADPLTGLPGRASFLDALEVAQERARRGGRTYAVLCLDLDNLRAINEGFGHHVGDRLLRWTTERLLEVVPDRMVARLGNDEFAVLLPADSAEPPEVQGKIILGALSQAVSLDDHLVYPSAKAGLAVADAETPDVDAPLRDAQSALAQAKMTSGSRLVRFNGALRAQHLALLQLDRDLRHAVATDQLRLHYQPIVGLVDGRVQGLEALLRWPHPDRGWVSPSEFVPQAERNGLIHPIGETVLTRACAMLVRLRAGAGVLREGYVSVNLAAPQVYQRDLVAQVRAALSSSGLPASALRLELTESAAMAEGERAVEVLSQLRELGVRLVIDDFGTGYSSLHYLARLPVDELKIDKSFVRGIGTDDRKTRVVSTIADLASSLELRVVAEGVETQAQVEVLRQLGVDAAQGFLFGRAQAEEDLFADLAALTGSDGSAPTAGGATASRSH
ncbi:MAG: bifunctional diguanylate cyclase/phosphodiesterase [Alphaproteobacteria bacterium]|nr:bifunctional diguanylate cyclase/phosphodiesterase [Alphaproteobacteria bacterium]